MHFWTFKGRFVWVFQSVAVDLREILVISGVFGFSGGFQLSLKGSHRVLGVSAAFQGCFRGASRTMKGNPGGFKRHQVHFWDVPRSVTGGLIRVSERFGVFRTIAGSLGGLQRITIGYRGF